MTAHTVEPVLQFTLYLPEQIFLLNIQRAVDDRFGNNIDGLQYRVCLVATTIKDRIKVYTTLNLAQIFLQYLFIDVQVLSCLTCVQRVTALLLTQVTKQKQRISIQISCNCTQMLPFWLSLLRIGVQIDAIDACQETQFRQQLIDAH